MPDRTPTRRDAIRWLTLVGTALATSPAFARPEPPQGEEFVPKDDYPFFGTAPPDDRVRGCAGPA